MESPCPVFAIFLASLTRSQGRIKLPGVSLRRRARQLACPIIWPRFVPILNSLFPYKVSFFREAGFAVKVEIIKGHLWDYVYIYGFKTNTDVPFI